MVQSNAPAEIYQLHILLLQINPPIWRRLHVRSDSSIATLHELLQIAFDWSDFHLHRFVIRGKEYGVSRMGCTTFTTDAAFASHVSCIAGYQCDSVERHSSFKTRVRTCSKRWAPRSVHPICCFFTMRLLTTAESHSRHELS